MIEFDEEKVTSAVVQAVAKAIKNGAEKIAEESIKQTPKDSGALQENCKVVVEDDLTVGVVYDLPYAVKVHEDMNVQHKSGKAKFLEDPFMDSIEDIVNSVAEEIGDIIL